MAISLATGNFLQYVNAGGVFDLNGDYTVFGWASHETGNGMTGIWAASNNTIATGYEYWGTDTNGVSSRMSVNGGNDFVDGNIPKDTWFWWAFRRDGDTLQLIIDGDVLIEEELPVGARGNAQRYELGHVQGALQAEVLVAYLRIWEAALTDEELESETFSATPVRSSDLWEYYQFTSGDLLGSSIGSRDFVDFASASFVADPTLPTPPASGYDLAGSASFALTVAAMQLMHGYPLAGSAAFELTVAPMTLDYTRPPSSGRKLMILRS